MIYTSFISKNTAYEKVVEKYLIPSLKKWNLPYDIDYIDNRGSWIKNIIYKPEYLKKMLLKHKQEIVSLDADAEILQYPSLFSVINDYDIGVHYLDTNLQWRNKSSLRKEALGGTLYFNYNDKILNFINDWCEEGKKSMVWSQRIMQKLITLNKYNLNILYLPYSYSVIIKQDGTLPNHMINKEDIVILHHQVSRELKNGL